MAASSPRVGATSRLTLRPSFNRGGNMEGRVEIIIKGGEKDKVTALYGLLMSLTDVEIRTTLESLGNSYITRFARLIHGELYRRIS